MTGRFLLCHPALWQSPAVLLFARHKNCSTSSPSRGETRFSFGGIPHDDDDLRVAEVAAAQHRSKPRTARAVRRFRRTYLPDVAQAMAVETSATSPVCLSTNSRDPLAPGNLGPGGSGARRKSTRTTLFSRSITQRSIAACPMVSPQDLLRHLMWIRHRLKRQDRGNQQQPRCGTIAVKLRSDWFANRGQRLADD
jgi:hypothetical protein